MFQSISGFLYDWIIAYIHRPSRKYEPFSLADPVVLRENLRPGDILLVEGNQRISEIIKYLTQSTWSHAAFYIGEALAPSSPDAEPLNLIEAGVEEGVVAVPLSKYANYNTRICRAVGLNAADRQKLVDFMVSSIGLAYDTRNITDLLRYLLPHPPVPLRRRRKMLALGSGDPTRAICSSLIAQAFQSIQYPILPLWDGDNDPSDHCAYTKHEIMHIRHHSLFTPRDFDISPYFQIVKPSIEKGFNRNKLVWE